MLILVFNNLEVGLCIFEIYILFFIIKVFIILGFKVLFIFKGINVLYEVFDKICINIG